MAKKTKRLNPFYVLLVLLGVAFAITSCAYGVMAVKEMHQSEYALAGAPRKQEVTDADKGFLAFMNLYGERILLSELVLLGAATFAAIGTDRFWSGDL